MEKPQLVNFIAKVLEDSGFRVYKNFKTSQQVIDIYAVLPTSIGDFGVVVACKNYDKEWEVGIDVLKEMEMIGKKLKASKVLIVTSSSFSSQAKRYSEEKKIKLVDRNNLVTLAKKYSDKRKKQEQEPARLERRVDENVNAADINSTDRYDINADYIENPYSDREPYYNRVYNPYDNYDEYESDLDYYESAVGGIDLSKYSEYDDELYRAEFLNKTAAQNEINRHANSRPILVSGQAKEEKSGSRFRKSKSTPNLSKQSHKPRQNNSKSRFKSNSDDILSRVNRPPKKERQAIGDILKPILSNIVVIIAIVVLVTYLIAYILSAVARVPAGYLGLVELIVALILSYILTLYTERSSDILVKGTIVFFVSLIILMIAMVAL